MFVESLDSTIDTTVYVELIQGAKSRRDVDQIEIALRQFEILHFNENVSRRTIDLIRAYSNSHGLMFGDAVIAATCLENQLVMVTINVKDFRFIDGLEMLVPKL